MPDLSPKQLKNEARLALAAGNGNHKRIVSIYSAIVLGVSLFTTFTYYIVELLILNTAGGLAGLGSIGILKSVASLVETVAQIAATFLAMSLLHCAIGFARQDPMEAKSLKEGFYRWGVFLRLVLLQGLMYIAFVYLAATLASTVYLFLPGMETSIQQAEPIVAQFQVTGVITEAQTFTLVQSMWPMFLMILGAVLLLVVPLFYSYRMSFYRIMDNNHPGARQAIAQSRVMMKKRRFKLFVLDLSFWWYYLLQALATIALSLVAVLLYNVFPEIELIVNVLLCGAMFLIYRKYLAYVETTYAVFYDKVLQLYLPQQPIENSVQWQTPVELIKSPEEEIHTEE